MVWGRNMASSLGSLAIVNRHSAISVEAENPESDGWTFLTNHAYVLLCVYRNPDRSLREVAHTVGITERMVQRIVMELVKTGSLEISKEGRRNRYVVNSKLGLRHVLGIHLTIGELLEVLG